MVAGVASQGRQMSGFVGETVHSAGALVKDSAEKHLGDDTDPTVAALGQVGASAVGGFFSVLGALYDSAGTILKSAGDAGAELTGEKYGEDAGKTAQHAVDSTADTVVAVRSMMALPVTFVKGV